MQLEFLWRDEDTLQRLLERETGLRLRLVVTDNSSTMLRVRREPGQQIGRASCRERVCNDV